MTRLTSKAVAVLALAIFAGACASKQAKLEYPEQPEPIETKILIPPPPETVTEKGEGKTLTQKVEEMKSYQKETKERTKTLRNEVLSADILDEKEMAIRSAAAEIEAEKAEKNARKKIAVYDTPAMRKARKEIEDAEEDAREALEDQIEAKKNTGLYCPNPKDFEKVWIHPSIRHSYQSVVHTRMTIENKAGALDIRRTAGRNVTNLVENMCSGGTITIFEKQQFGSANSTRVGYRAISVSGEELRNPESPHLYMYHCNYIGCQNEFPATWEIRKAR